MQASEDRGIVTERFHNRSSYAKTAIPAGLITVVVSVAVYWLTAFRTITWWDNANYSIAAVTLGITPPPGSLLLTLLGWIVTRLPLGISNIFSLNLFAGVMAALTAGLVCLIAAHLIRGIHLSDNRPLRKGSLAMTLAGTVIGGLTFSFSETLWLYAVKFTPYVLTALFTTMILWTLIRWWESAEQPNAFRWLFIVTLLFGLDFSVHRTNLLMLPGLFFWILLRHPKTFAIAKSWLYGISGFAAGLAIHLLIIPIAARAPFLNFNNPDSLSRFWNYISLKQFGGGFLVNLYPRKAAFFKIQTMDYLNSFAANFLSADRAVMLLSVLPLLLGLTGLILLWRRNRRLAVGLAILFLTTSAGAIVYFNVPAGFFRSMDRHYLPSFVIFSIWIAYGIGSILLSVWNLRGRHRWFVAGLVGLLFIVMPINQLVRNLRYVDSSDNHFTCDFAKNVFSTLPANAIIFTGGDNDTWPLLYLQAAEGMRPDVTVLNISLLNTPWFIEQIISKDPKFPLALTEDEISQIAPKPWRDTTIAVPVRNDPEIFQLPKDTALPDSLYLHIPPSIAGKYILGHEWLLIQMISQNRWERPIYFSSTMSPGVIPWLHQYLRVEGIAQRLIPIESPPLNKELLRRNLLEKYVYHGYANPAIRIDQPSRYMGWNLYAAFGFLAKAEEEEGNNATCEEIKKEMLELLPPDRLKPPPPLQKMTANLCKTTDD